MKDQNASTPRLDESLQKPPSKKELMKKCFGFDDSSESDDTAKTPNGSLVGDISPVRNMTNLPNRNTFITPAQNVPKRRNDFTVPNNSALRDAKPFRFEPIKVFRRPVKKAINCKSTVIKSKSSQVLEKQISAKIQKDSEAVVMASTPGEKTLSYWFSRARCNYVFKNIKIILTSNPHKTRTPLVWRLIKLTIFDSTNLTVRSNGKDWD